MTARKDPEEVGRAIETRHHNRVGEASAGKEKS